jgi:hypothetical protein
MRASRPPTGVLVIRIWLEQNEMRARISRSLDIEAGETAVCVVAGAGEIKAIVTRWLRQFAARAGAATRL